MADRGSRPWVVETDDGAFFDDFDDEERAKSAAKLANETAQKLKLKTTYNVKRR